MLQVLGAGAFRHCRSTVSHGDGVAASAAGLSKSRLRPQTYTAAFVFPTMQRILVAALITFETIDVHSLSPSVAMNLSEQAKSRCRYIRPTPATEAVPAVL
jgi:hypothetical protein